MSKIRVLPEKVRLKGNNASQRLLVMGTDASGREHDATALSRMQTKDAKVVTVDRDARLKAAGDGRTQIAVTVGGLRALVDVEVQESQSTRPFSFARDIEGVFTKGGCNSSDCHGSVKGKAGFKLSANGLYPRDDYRWITEGGIFQVLTAESGGPKVPRIDLANPERSLLLLKPTTQVAHGGGKRITLGSTDYETILNWIRQRAPYGAHDASAGVRVVRLEVIPAESVLMSSESQRLLVSAVLSDGTYEDVTDQVLYVSNNPNVAAVSSDGLITAGNSGEAAVMIRSAGQFATARVGVIGRALALYPEVPTNNYIDRIVNAKLRRFNIIPSELSSDEEFLRRICLDLTGKLPPVDRLRQFVGDKDPGKRMKLISALMDTPEFVDYWTFRFADLFRVAAYAQGNPKYSEYYYEWIRDSIARNKPYDEMARERISAQGFDGPTRHYYHSGGELPKPQDMMAEQVRVFFGRRLDCAQCHNHPYETWSQNQFWGMAAFFGNLTRLGQLGRDMIIVDDPAGHGEFGQGGKVIHPRTNEVVIPQFLDNSASNRVDQLDPRRSLADWMTAHPYFAEATVNRIWSLFFQRGIVHPVDDFRDSNPPTNPQLLQALAEDFKTHAFDLRNLIRTIVQSRTYQLSSVPNNTNAQDWINYSRALARPLDAEVLLDAVSSVTGVPQQFVTWMGGMAPAGTRAIQLLTPDSYPSHFLNVYGRPNRLMVPDRKVDANLGQALHLLVGETYNLQPFGPGSRLDRMIASGASPARILEELYLAALGRWPTEEEKSAEIRLIAQAPDVKQALEDFMCGLLGSREFAYNH